MSELSKDNLKISPCKFYGSNPNQVGNLCIAGHNYNNNTLFSNLYKLSSGDIITLYDTSNNYLDYIVYETYKTNADDLTCISQETNNKKVITLITCDNINANNRIIVKAQELTL